MAKIYGAQRALGYHNIVYNIKSGKFFVPLPGDNYYELDIQTGSDSVFLTTATLPLANPTRETRADNSNLKTQEDLNIYFDKWIREVAASGGDRPGGTVDQLPELQ